MMSGRSRIDCDPDRLKVARRSGRLRRGFTLIEVMVVMAILALSFGMMLPTISEFMKNRKLDGVGADLTSGVGDDHGLAVIDEDAVVRRGAVARELAEHLLSEKGEDLADVWKGVQG